MRKFTPMLLLMVLAGVLSFDAGLPAQTPTPATSTGTPPTGPTPTLPGCDGTVPKPSKCSWFGSPDAPKEALRCDPNPIPNDASGSCARTVAYNDKAPFECGPGGATIACPWDASKVGYSTLCADSNNTDTCYITTVCENVTVLAQNGDPALTTYQCRAKSAFAQPKLTKGNRECKTNTCWTPVPTTPPTAKTSE